MNEKNVLSDLLEKFSSNYKSSNHYYPRSKIPMYTFADIKKLAVIENQVPMIKAFLVHLTVEATYEFLTTFFFNPAFKGENIQRLAHERAIVELCGHGECGPLASTLIVDLLERRMGTIFTQVSIEAPGKVKGSTCNHGFIIVEDQEKPKIALDPYFGICCPLTEYYKQPKLIEYFSALTGLPESMMTEYFFVFLQNYKPYQLKQCIDLLPLLRNQIAIFKELAQSDQSIFPKILNQLEYVATLTQSNLHIGDAIRRIKASFKLVQTAKYLAASRSATSHENLDESKLLAYKKETKRFLKSYFDFFKDPHECLKGRIEAIYKLNLYIEPFYTCIVKGEYERALRIACKDEIMGYKLASILLTFKNDLKFDIEARAQSNNLNAMDYAKANKDERIVALLLQHLDVAATSMATLGG